MPDAASLVAYVVFSALLLRSVRVAGFVFLYFNYNVYRVAAMQVQIQGRGPQSSPKRRDQRDVVGPSRPPNLPNIPSPPRPARRSDKQLRVPPNQSQTPQPPPPYSVSPPQAQHDSIIELYESIIAADAQTMNVQQQTLASQLDIIRSQSQMIVKLRHVLEEQDCRIEELEERCRGRGAPRSRSS